MWPHVRPFAFFECPARRFHRFINVGLVAFSDECQHFLVCRINGLEGFAGLRCNPFAIDQQLLGRLAKKVQRRTVFSASERRFRLKLRQPCSSPYDFLRLSMALCDHFSHLIGVVSTELVDFPREAP
jgi:hypothetical protein